MPENSIFLDVQGLSKSYPAGKSLGWRRPRRRVLKNISFSVQRGEILGLLGESGSGKSTLARCLLGLEEPDAGEMLFEGQKSALWRKRYRGAASVVFQDYLTSVNPGFRVSEIIAEGYLAGGGKPKELAESVALLMQRVNLPLHLASHLPHQLSGGQLQRVCIARALASKPSFMVFDEALSALDVSIQSQILDLLRAIKANMTYFFITHDLQMAALLCDRLLLLKDGEIVGTEDCSKLSAQKSPYLQELMDSTIVFSSAFADTPKA